MNMFCPFIKANCRDDCIFNLPDYEEHERNKCCLYDGMDILRSFQAPDYIIDQRQQEMIKLLSNVEINTSSDQTESYSINSTLDDIKSLLKEYLKNQN